jgi:RimJ/RimL family protein N-acetyltransferase
MSTLLFGHDKTVAEWVAKQAHSKAPVPPYTAFGFIDREGVLVGGCVFTGYNGDTVELSLAGRVAATRTGWAAIINYVFDQLGCSRMQMHTRRSNRRVLRMLAKRLGVQYEGVARHYFGKNEHGVVYALTVDNLAAFRAKWGL